MDAFYFLVGFVMFLYIAYFKQKRNPNSTVESKLAVVVRISNPTESQIKRYFEWELSLPDYYEFWFIINPTNETVEIHKKNTYSITMKRVFEQYPNITELKLPNRCKSYRKDDKFYMWVSHTESIIQWYHYTNDKYDYIWILEQDLGVSGSLSTILDHYNESRSDLITYNVKEENSKWPHFRCYSNNYISWRLKYIDENKMYTTKEFIQRWSKKLINKLDENLNNGIHAISEASVIETTIFYNLTYQLLNKEDIGYAFDWNHRVSKKGWEKILKDKSKQNKLYHALKF